mgnify:CR=1 FL=1
MQSFDLNNIWEHILQEAKKNMQHLPDALYLRHVIVDSHVSRQSFDPYWGHANIC